MNEYTFSKESSSHKKLLNELADSFIDDSKVRVIEDLDGEIKFYCDPALSGSEQTLLASIVSVHTSTEDGEENFFVKSFNSKGNIETETWYHTDNEDGSYSGKVREISYSYSKKGRSLIGRTEKEFWLDGTEKKVDTFGYYSSGGNHIVKKI